MTVPTGICRCVGGLAVAEPDDVDGGDDLALAGGQRVDRGDHLARVEHLDRLAAGGGDQADVLGLERGQHRAAVTRAQRGDVGVAQRLVQVRTGAAGADLTRAGEHADERVLDQILGVVMRARHAAGGAAEAVDVDRERLGIQRLGHATRLPFRRRSLIWGIHP